jgi:hypothetical protein
MYNILVGNWTFKSIWKQNYLIFSYVYVLQKNNIVNLFQCFTPSSYYLGTRSDIANCPAINLINELIIYCLLFAAPYPDSQRAVCSAAGGLVPRPCLRPLASRFSTRYSAGSADQSADLVPGVRCTWHDIYTVKKKIFGIPVPSRDVTIETLPRQE